MRTLPRQLWQLGKQPPRWRFGTITGVTKVVKEEGEFTSYFYVLSVQLGDGVVLNNVGIYGGANPNGGSNVETVLLGAGCAVFRFGANSVAMPVSVTYES